MLPTEVFVDAVAFLRLFDLSALAVANAMCASLALKASTAIRWEEFAELRFWIHDEQIRIFRRTDASVGVAKRRLQRVAALTFASENDTAEFIAAAFPNCIFENVTIFCYDCKSVLDAIARVADSVVIKGSLLLDSATISNEFFDVARKFRDVKVLQLARKVSDDEASKIADFCRGHGVRELQYYRSYYEAPTSVALL